MSYNYKFPTYQELMAMPLSYVKNQNIQTGEQEALVQQVLNERRESTLSDVQIYRRDVPMQIMDGATEAKWQKILDERKAEALKKIQVETEGTLETKLKILNEQKDKLDKICQFCDTKSKIRHLKVCTRPK